MKSIEPQDSDGFLQDLDALADGSGGGAGLAHAAGSLAGLTTSPQSRVRVLEALQPYERFVRFEAAVAELLHVSMTEAAAALQRIDDPTAWLAQAPGVAYLPVAGSPEAGFFLAGFLRVEAGMEFPEHEHLGEEVTFVLQGAFEESCSGALFLPGQPSRMPGGSRHTFRVPADGPHLVGLVTVKTGVRFASAP